jgi:site-specific DNA-methyltransferase (adenine-specific)
LIIGDLKTEEEMQIKMVPIADIIPYENNPRKNSEAVKYVVNSIREFGFKIPMVLDANNVIVCGHTRFLAAKKLGMSEVPCTYADDLTEEQIKAFRLADNKTAEFAEWDIDKLTIELQELPDINMADFGFLDNIDDLQEAAEITEDTPPEVEEGEPITVPGDLWLVGQHRLICGDSTKPEDVARLMDGQKADLFLTDPPYNVDYTGGTKDALKIMNDNMDDVSFRKFLQDAFARANEVMRAGAVFYIWHADSEGYNFRGACKDVGWQVRECLIWNKSSLVLGRQDYQWKHEPCLYGWKDGAPHLWASDRKQTTVLDFDKPLASKLHPTMKPVSLFAYQLGNNTHEGDAVLDLFGGSGTTLIACEQLNRRAFTSELDPKYCDVIVKRYINLKGSEDGVFVLREGTKIPYSEIKKDN